MSIRKPENRPATNGERVCLIVTADFGTQLRTIDKAAPIWIVQSPANDAVIADLWNRGIGDITRFRPLEFDQLLDMVDEHHPHWKEIEVRGLNIDDATAALSGLEGTFSRTPDGFLFRQAGA